MRIYLLRDGKLYLASELARGRPIVWSREQWLSRYRSMLRRTLRDAILYSGAIACALVGMIALMEYATTGGSDDAGLMAIVLTCLLAVYVGTVAIFLVYERLALKGPMRELTTMGIQLYPNLFIPYTEISEVRARRRDVKIVPRRAPELVPWNIAHHTQWSFDIGLLGEWGSGSSRRGFRGTSRRPSPPSSCSMNTSGRGRDGSYNVNGDEAADDLRLHHTCARKIIYKPFSLRYSVVAPKEAK